MTRSPKLDDLMGKITATRELLQRPCACKDLEECGHRLRTWTYFDFFRQTRYPAPPIPAVASSPIFHGSG